MLFFGIAAGLPLLLIFSSLSLWLREAGVARSAVTYFSWAALGYSFKFVWAPLIDVLPLPFLTRWLGRRRAWILFSQCMIMIAIATMAMINPATQSLTMMALAAVLLGFSSATQDIVIDAYRIESAGEELQALMSASYIAGYRIGMLLAGAGALFIASQLGTSMEMYHYHAWQMTYLLMALTMLIGVMTTLLIDEPEARQNKTEHSLQDYLGLLTLFAVAVLSFIISYVTGGHYLAAAISGFWLELARLVVAILVTLVVVRLSLLMQWVNKRVVMESYVQPIQDFFQRYGWSLAWLLLALIGLYRISDIVLGVISNVFYQDLGYSKDEIAAVVKSFGLLMTIVGGFLGGLMSLHYGVMRILLLGAILSAATNLLFMWLAQVGYDMPMLYLVISADNLSAGLASAAFVAFLSSLTNVSFTAVQYAIFSSLMTLLPKFLGGYSGTMVDSMGYENFFLLTAGLGVPVLVLIMVANRLFELKQT